MEGVVVVVGGGSHYALIFPNMRSRLIGEDIFIQTTLMRNEEEFF